MALLKSVTVYQKGDIVHNPPLTEAVPLTYATASPVTHPETRWLDMVGANGERPDASIAPYVYGVINVPTPSQAGTTAWFIAETVASIVASS